MSTNNTSHVLLSKNRKENRRALCETTEVKIQGEAIFSKRQILRRFGILSTLLIGLASLAPDVFGIPLDLRPWVFLTSIFWFLAFCSGIFDL
jgi:hypothetical protein